MKRLPASTQEIADVIGRERALFLVGRLPRCYMPDGRYKGAQATRVILYVQKRMTADHELVRILGWHDAEKLRKHFGGCLLHPAPCADIYRRFRDESLRDLASQGTPVEMLADWFSLSARHVKNILAGEPVEIPQEARKAANDETFPTVQRKAG